jgi:hypothetical protein
MPQGTAVEVVTILETVGRHRYWTFAKMIKVLGMGDALIRLGTNGTSSTRRIHMATEHVKRR